MNRTYTRWFIDTSGNEKANDMLSYVGKDAKLEPVLLDGEQYLMWKCTQEFADKFEKTCSFFQIPITIWIRHDDGQMEVWRSAPVALPIEALKLVRGSGHSFDVEVDKNRHHLVLLAS